LRLKLTNLSKSLIERPGTYLRLLFGILKKENFFLILGVTSLFLLASSLLFYSLENGSGHPCSLGDSVWWAVTTITTVGYGDVVPRSGAGRLLATGLMFSGLILFSLLTASVASVFVEEKIKEAKGLETIKETGHIIICGWNHQAERVLRSILELTFGRKTVVLINELPREEVDSIKYLFREASVRHVRGDFVRQDVLARAGVPMASSVVVLADSSTGRALEATDQRTIFATMAIKAMAPSVRTCAELLFAENKEHLLRANVDEVVVRGELGGALLAAGAVATGLPEVIGSLLSFEEPIKLWKMRIPPDLIGRPCAELKEHLRSEGATLIAILTETAGIQLSDILSADATAIDAFIRHKFEQSGKEFFSHHAQVRPTLNPPDGYVISSTDSAVVLAEEKVAARVAAGGAGQ
jgi:voltage-gated potassium channel